MKSWRTFILSLYWRHQAKRRLRAKRRGILRRWDTLRYKTWRRFRSMPVSAASYHWLCRRHQGLNRIAQRHATKPVLLCKSKHLCQARQHSDSMVCEQCQLTWAMSDPEPPTCRL